jgi:hypothetical protein
VTDEPETVTLWRPAGPEELALVEASGWREWPPRLPGQPIFYPVLNEQYATMIARDWNVRHSGAGYVTRFQVRRAFLDRYEVHQHRRHDRTCCGVPLTGDHISAPIRATSVKGAYGSGPVATRAAGLG